MRLTTDELMKNAGLTNNKRQVVAHKAIAKALKARGFRSKVIKLDGRSKRIWTDEAEDCSQLSMSGEDILAASGL